jgi:heme/copper-type cytochrome/quinol oxidase subunit 4
MKQRDAMTDKHVETYTQDFRSYCIGGLLALILTALAFGLVVFEVLPNFERLIAISVLAVA